MGDFPRYLLGANGNQWLWDGFFADAHSCLCSSKEDHAPPIPSSMPHPCEDICFCKFPDSPSHANFSAPLAKPWILHLFHFLPFQMGTTTSHLLLWSLLDQKDEGGWGQRYTSLYSIQKRCSWIKSGALNSNNLKKKKMDLCWLGSEAQESPYKPLLSIENSQQGKKLIFIEYLLFVWPSVRCLILSIYLHLSLTNLMLLYSINSTKHFRA